MLVLVGALITVVYLQFGPAAAEAPTGAASATRHPDRGGQSGSGRRLGRGSTSPPGRTTPAALILAELFPARFATGGTTAVRTVGSTPGTNCARMVLGGKLQAALRQGGCTQVMRASYLSAGQQIMATIGVLNLANVTAASRPARRPARPRSSSSCPARRGRPAT